MYKALTLAAAGILVAACQIPDTTPLPDGQVYRAIVGDYTGTHHIDKKTRRACEKSRMRFVISKPGGQVVKECHIVEM